MRGGASKGILWGGQSRDIFRGGPVKKITLYVGQQLEGLHWVQGFVLPNFPNSSTQGFALSASFNFALPQKPKVVWIIFFQQGTYKFCLGLEKNTFPQILLDGSSRSSSLTPFSLCSSYLFSSLSLLFIVPIFLFFYFCFFSLSSFSFFLLLFVYNTFLKEKCR